MKVSFGTTAAVEQAYIEHQLNDRLAVRAGLFLVPLGLLNDPGRRHGREPVSSRRAEATQR